MPSYTAYIIETLVTLVAVCALAFVVLWGARRLGIGRPSGPMELRGHLPLDARRAIYLVQVGSQVFIVGVGEGVFTKLGELPASDLPDLSMTQGPTFADVLARARGGFARTPERSAGSSDNQDRRTAERSEGASERLGIGKRPPTERE